MNRYFPKSWQVTELGGGPWNRPRVYTVASPLAGAAESLDPLRQYYPVFWPRNSPYYATNAERRPRKGSSGLPVPTLWCFDRHELVEEWADLLMARGHVVPRGIPAPAGGLASCRGGLIEVSVPPKPTLDLTARASRGRIVSIPADSLGPISRKISAHVFRIREMRMGGHWKLYLMGELVPRIRWIDADEHSELLGRDGDVGNDFDVDLQ